MRVASWNLNHWQRRHEPGRIDVVIALLKERAVDVALLQEVGDLPASLPHDYQRQSQLRAGSDYGTAVVAVNPAAHLEPLTFAPADGAAGTGQLWSSHPGTISAATVSLDGTRLDVVSVYGRMFQAGNGTSYASTTMHRIISDLVSILHPFRGATPVLLAGDFNCTTQWDDARDRAMDATVFQRLEAHQMVDLLKAGSPMRTPLDDCFCPDVGTCDHVRTLRHRDAADSRPFHIDYAFASASVADRCTAALADDDAVWAMSDHCMIVVDVES